MTRRLATDTAALAVSWAVVLGWAAACGAGAEAIPRLVTRWRDA